MSKYKELLSDWKYVKICIYVLITAALLYVIYLIIGNFSDVMLSISSIFDSITSAFSPLIIGLILTYLLSPLVDFIDKNIMSKFFFLMPTDAIKYEKRMGLRRTISILITFLFIILIICAIIYAFAVLIVGQLVFTSLQSMVESIIAYFIKYEAVIRDWAMALPNSNIEQELQNIINSVIAWFSNNFSTTAIIAFVANVGGSILNVVLGAVVSIYVLKDKDFFIRLWRKTLHILLPMKTNSKVTSTLSEVNTVLSQFVRGQLLDALIIAVLSSIGLTMIGLDFAVFIGCFAGITNVIPYFGPVLGMVPAAIIGLLTGGISQALLAVLVLLFIQQIDANIIYPRVVGSSTGLHPVFVLVSITVGGYYWGIIGMLLAVPIAAIIRVFLIKKIESIE